MLIFISTLKEVMSQSDLKSTRWNQILEKDFSQEKHQFLKRK